MDYPLEVLSDDEDCGVMPDNMVDLAGQVVGHRIVAVEQAKEKGRGYGYTGGRTTLVLDTGRRVILRDTYDCCAYTTLHAFLLHPDKVDHIITGVGTTNGYETWHIYADAGDVLELTVDWSCGNPFYYAYGFEISVEDGPRVWQSLGDVPKGLPVYGPSDSPGDQPWYGEGPNGVTEYDHWGPFTEVPE